MWITSALDLDQLAVPALYTPPSYRHSVHSPNAYVNESSNTIENVSSLNGVSRLLSRLKFIPLMNFIYKDLILNIYPIKLYTQTDIFYPRVDITDLTLTDSYSYEDNLYQSAKLDTLFVHRDSTDLHLRVGYQVRNITTFNNIALFTVPNTLTEILLKNSAGAIPQKVTADFLASVPLTKETTVTFIYDTKVYDSNTGAITGLLNNSIQLKSIPSLCFTHSLPNYTEIDLLIYRDKIYKRMYGIETVNALFNTQTHRGFVIGKNNLALLG